MVAIKKIMERMEKNSRREFLYITIFFTCFVFGILCICGTLTSGIHLVDDHEFWTFSNMMNLDNMTIKEVIDWKMEGDYAWRFRPLYYPIRVIQAAVFGTDLIVLSILKGMEIVLACVFCYMIARKLHCSITWSIIVVFVVLVGPQSAIWWKLGPQESTGTWLYALGILCLFYWKETGKKIYNIVALFLFLFVSLFKESFIALFPATMLIYIFFSMRGKAVTWKNFWRAVKENLISELILGLILLAEMYIIVFVIGTNGREYIGIDPNIGIWFYVKMFLNNFRLYLRVGQYGLFVVALLILLWKNMISILKDTKWHFLLACLITLPQFLIYAKSGLEERYVIPWVYGVAYFFIIVLHQSKFVIGAKRKYYNITVTLLLVINFVILFYEGFYFSYRGRGITRMFDAVTEIATEETKILTAFTPYDESHLTAVAVLEREGIRNVYIHESTWIDDTEKIKLKEMDEIDIILMYNEKDRHYLYDQGIDLSDFEVEEYNTVCMAVRK